MDGPIREAGGGLPSSTQQGHEAGVAEFSPVVLSHLKRVFASLSGKGAQSPDVEAATSFLSNVQQEDDVIASGSPSQLVDQYLPGIQGGGFNAFLTYMGGPRGNAMSASKKHDLNFPISNYYISSSHNTYLTGNQLYSNASTDSYKNVLLRGCRCLEIDVWDGGTSSASSSDAEPEDSSRLSPDQSRGTREKLTGKLEGLKIRARSKSTSRDPSGGQGSHLAKVKAAKQAKEVKDVVADVKPEPRVLHGYTLTKEITFRAVCNTIRESAFVATDLPVIVSLEVHASLEQQETMVEIMRQSWQNLLVDISDHSEDKLVTLPSPAALRGKILIKVKWSPPEGAEQSNDPLDHVTTASSGRVDEEGDEGEPETKKKSSKILHALSSLGVYTQGYTFKHFGQPEAAIPSHVFSLSEAKVVDMHENHRDDLVAHNRDYLMRAYPAGIRVNSSNLEPVFLWRQGVQMAALNWQKWDKGMMLNEGMFAGEEGWVLKPGSLRGTVGTPNRAPSAPKRTLSLTIALLAGQNLPLPADEKAKKFHPYVKLELLYGVDKPKSSDDSASTSKKYKSVSKTAKGIGPDFAGESFRFADVPDVVEELTFLRVKVKDDNFGKDVLAGWACVRLDKLRCGYRFVHLLSSKGVVSPGVLLLKIDKVFS